MILDVFPYFPHFSQEMFFHGNHILTLPFQRRIQPFFWRHFDKYPSRYPEKILSQSSLLYEVIFGCSINHKQKLHCPNFRSTSPNIPEWSIMVKFSINHTIFLKLCDVNSCSYSFINIRHRSLGYVSKSEHQKLRQTFTFIDVILHYLSATGDTMGKKLVYVKNVYCQSRWQVLNPSIYVR